MPTAFEDHGGAVPPPFHIRRLPDQSNQCLILLTLKTVSQALLHFFRTLPMDQVLRVVVCLPEDHPRDVPNIHPMIDFATGHPNEIAKEYQNLLNLSGFFILIQSNEYPIHPNLWRLLRNTKPGSSVQYTDEKGSTHRLVYIDQTGPSTNVIESGQIAAYHEFVGDAQRNLDSLHTYALRSTKVKLHELTIDTSDSYTPLCYLGTRYATDKSPYNQFHHRHPYTAVYDTFLRPYTGRSAPIKLGEVGVLNGSSLRMWRDYFPDAELHGFDINEQCVQNCSSIPRVQCHILDASKTQALQEKLGTLCADGKKFTILIEDASHQLAHQLLFIRDAIQYVESGGVLIVEDIFRDIPLARFEEALEDVSEKVLNAVMVRTEHKYKFSPGWDNDRILFVWVR